MSTSPLPVRRMPDTAEQKQHRDRAALRSDAMYFAGAWLMSAGAWLFRHWVGLVVFGLFLALPPLLELASGFLKGLRSRPSR
jgi:hypothetical protein